MLTTAQQQYAEPEVFWQESKGSLAPFVRDRYGERRAAWAAFPGSQQLVLTCPVFELLYEGTRGPGKSETMLMDFGQHCGVGFHSEWRGILFRRTYKQLGDIISKSKRLYPRIFPEARFIASDAQLKWVWPSGEELLFRVFKRPERLTCPRG